MTPEPKSERDLDTRLDEALEMTFPASNPIAVHSPDGLRSDVERWLNGGSLGNEF
jgi:hypothetical protein